MTSLLLQGKTDEEIILECTTDKIGDEECTPELLESLLAQAKENSDEDSDEDSDDNKKVKPVASGETMFGNKDKNKEHPFPKHWAKHVVVRHSETRKFEGTEESMEVPSTVHLQVYDPAIYDSLVKDKAFKGKNTKVIHEPK